MTRHSCLAAALMLAAALPAAARSQAQPEPKPGPARVDVVTPQAAPIILDDKNARDTRERLRKVLDQYPPTVRDVLRLDPSLLSRPEYLATYPGLAAFLAQHPEVAHNPAFFVGDARGVIADNQPQDARVEAVRAWRNFGEMIPVVAIVFIITSALAGVIKTLLDQRRWQRATRVQLDMQNKLIDRFSSSDELLAYLQSPTGRALSDLQSPPIMAAGASRIMDAPLGRIFWSLQAGIVLGAAGLGLFLVGNRFSDEIAATPITGLGILAAAVGLGFIVSAGASYLISHRLGLVAPATPPDVRAEGRGA
jgi:hypothetical protein